MASRPKAMGELFDPCVPQCTCSGWLTCACTRARRLQKVLPFTNAAFKKARALGRFLPIGMRGNNLHSMGGCTYGGPDGANYWHRHGEARQVTVTKPAATGRALRDTWDLPFSEASQAVLDDYIEVLPLLHPDTPHLRPNKPKSTALWNNKSHMQML